MITILILNTSRRDPPRGSLGRHGRGSYPSGSMTTQDLLALHRRLFTAYGPQDWWPGGDDPFEVIVGAILTQRCSWTNASLAIEALRRDGLLAPKPLRRAPIGEVAARIRPALFYNEKAKKLRAFVGRLHRSWDDDLDRFLSQPMDRLRAELLGIHGIGEETADAILLYAAGKPSFVIDAYTRRLLSRLGWIDGRERYAVLRDRFMTELPNDSVLFNEYHALVVEHGKTRCRVKPDCGGCPLADWCTMDLACRRSDGSGATRGPG